ncbi:hypothetical protein C9422_16605 [Pseudomonas sp. B1(2018)]|nr:hypothetical protein C9422_16605 [Pseudomonas sp. B1(2018)]
MYATSASNRDYCGSSLLAIAVGQPTPMLAVMTPSRASSLPQGLVGVRNICQQPKSLWELARDSGGSANTDAGCNDAIASKLAPTGEMWWIRVEYLWPVSHRSAPRNRSGASGPCCVRR